MAFLLDWFDLSFLSPSVPHLSFSLFLFHLANSLSRSMFLMNLET